MSSSVWEVCGWVTEEVAPADGVVETLDENEPISAPIKLGRAVLYENRCKIDSQRCLILSFNTN